MCEQIPARCMPPPRAEECGVSRRVVLAGAGSLLLTACAPVRSSLPRRGPRRLGVRQALSPKAPPPYRVVTRETWGAEPLKPNHDPMDGVTRVTLHHTAELPGMNTRTDAELVKGVQNFHRNERGWADIGYHWLIGRDGNVYEGRALDIQGAHAGGGNNVRNLGISVVGDFTKELPPAAQLRTTALFLAEQLAKYDVPRTELYGHRDFKATECPGGVLYAWLGRFKKSPSV